MNKLTKQKEIIERSLELLKEGKFDEYKDLILRNIKEFPEEVQKGIISSFIEAEIIKETYKLRKLSEILDQILEILSKES